MRRFPFVPRADSAVSICDFIFRMIRDRFQHTLPQDKKLEMFIPYAALVREQFPQQGEFPFFLGLGTEGVYSRFKLPEDYFMLFS